MKRTVLLLFVSLTVYLSCSVHKTHLTEHRLGSWFFTIDTKKSQLYVANDRLDNIAVLSLQNDVPSDPPSLTITEKSDSIILSRTGSETFQTIITTTDSTVAIDCMRDTCSWVCTVPLTQTRTPLFHHTTGKVVCVKTVTEQITGLFNKIYDHQENKTIYFQPGEGLSVSDSDGMLLSGTLTGGQVLISLSDEYLPECFNDDRRRVSMSGVRIQPGDSLVALQYIPQLSQQIANTCNWIWFDISLDLQHEIHSVILNNPYHFSLQELFKTVSQYHLRPGLRVTIDPVLKGQPRTLKNIFTSLRKQGLQGVEICCRDSSETESIVTIAQKVFSGSLCRGCDGFTTISPAAGLDSGPEMYTLAAGPQTGYSMQTDLFMEEAWSLEAVLTAAVFLGGDFQYIPALPITSVQTILNLQRISQTAESRNISKVEFTDLDRRPFIYLVKIDHSGDAVMLFNPAGEETFSTISLRDDLRLSADFDYVIFDYWNCQIVGIFKEDLDLSVLPHQVRTLIIRPHEQRPQFLSSSRSIYSQSVNTVQWDDSVKKLRGESVCDCPGPYSLYFHIPYNWSEPRVYSDGKISYQKKTGDLLEVKFGGNRKKGRSLHWTLDFNQEMQAL